jgi:hypothetical protein
MNPCEIGYWSDRLGLYCIGQYFYKVFNTKVIQATFLTSE